MKRTNHERNPKSPRHSTLRDCLEIRRQRYGLCRPALDSKRRKQLNQVILGGDRQDLSTIEFSGAWLVLPRFCRAGSFLFNFLSWPNLGSHPSRRMIGRSRKSEPPREKDDRHGWRSVLEEGATRRTDSGVAWISTRPGGKSALRLSRIRAATSRE